MRDGCPFCDYAGPSPILHEYHGGDSKQGVFVIEPINPVVPGHVLVIPRDHVQSFADIVPSQLGAVIDTMVAAASYARGKRGLEQCNFIASRGEAATQTVAHLHVHLVPRREGDGLMLPWSTP